MSPKWLYAFCMSTTRRRNKANAFSYGNHWSKIDVKNGTASRLMGSTFDNSLAKNTSVKLVIPSSYIRFVFCEIEKCIFLDCHPFDFICSTIQFNSNILYFDSIASNVFIDMSNVLMNKFVVSGNGQTVVLRSNFALNGRDWKIVQIVFEWP